MQCSWVLHRQPYTASPMLSFICGVLGDVVHRDDLTAHASLESTVVVSASTLMSLLAGQDAAQKHACICSLALHITWQRCMLGC